ncbi:MAG: ATP-binding protein [bacterium]|nr:ATP-binding protein [bacterium]
MLTRTLSKTIKQIDKTFPVLLVTGPRQVGKTTLLEMSADGERNYVTLDDIQQRELARSDPALFLQSHKTPLTIDEVQYAPELFSAIKIIVDREKKNGLFWLTGSQKFHLMRGITESLAGRVAIVDLLGFSQAEIEGRSGQDEAFLPTPEWVEQTGADIKQPKALQDVYERIWAGAFPRLVQNADMPRDIFYKSYVQTYIHRDVRDIVNITDDVAFHRFLATVAARTGQLLNYSDIARDVDIEHKTAKAWLSVLETSGLVYLLQPYHSNVTKRIIKTPKLYFLDTGLCSYLTQWPTAASLEAGAMSGAFLETFMFSEILKSYWHHGKTPHLYFYRDTDQREIDLVIEMGDALYPVEFKKTANPTKQSTRQFHLLEKLGKKVGHGAVICFVEKPVPLTQEATAIPVGYL